MTIEASQTINQLNTSFPRASDLLKEGDDHIRMLKANLKNTFPRITGVVNFSSDDLNALDAAVTATANGVTFKRGISMAAGQTITMGRPSDEASFRNMGHEQVMTFGHLRSFFRMMYPKGSLFITNGVNPATLPFFAGTQWNPHWPGRYLMSATNTGAAGDTGWHVDNSTAGGSTTFTISQQQLPNHYHSIPEIGIHGSIWTGGMSGNQVHDHAGGTWAPGGEYGGQIGIRVGGSDHFRPRMTDSRNIDHTHPVGFNLATNGSGTGSISSSGGVTNQPVGYAPACFGVAVWIRVDNNGVGV